MSIDVTRFVCHVIQLPSCPGWICLIIFLYYLLPKLEVRAQESKQNYARAEAEIGCIRNLNFGWCRYQSMSLNSILLMCRREISDCHSGGQRRNLFARTNKPAPHLMAAGSDLANI